MSHEQPIQAHIRAMIRNLNNAGLAVRINADPDAFRDFYRDASGVDPVPPINPDFVELIPGRFRWVEITDQAGQRVCGLASSVFAAPWWRGGLRGLMRHQRLFSGRVKPLYAPAMEIEQPGFNLTGQLGYVGGGWTVRNRRGEGLIGHAIQLAYAHLVEHDGIDHLFGFVRPGPLVKLALSPTGYWFEHQVPLRTDYWCATGQPETLHLVHTSRAELLARYGRQPAYALPAAPQASPFPQHRAA